MSSPNPRPSPQALRYLHEEAIAHERVLHRDLKVRARVRARVLGSGLGLGD